MASRPTAISNSSLRLSPAESGWNTLDEVKENEENRILYRRSSGRHHALWRQGVSFLRSEHTVLGLAHIGDLIHIAVAAGDLVGKAVGFNVHWDSTNGCVQIESDKPYTGTAPAKTQSVAVGAKKADYTQADVMPEPKAGDKIPCSDGYVYEITDVSKYQNSMFATQETAPLPDPTCDWSLLDQPTLPEPEANHFTSGGKEYMFVRNLFETRRMQYTLYNAIGDNPQTWQNGKPVTRADGSPLVTVKLSIPESVAANSFWPWRSDQIVELFNSCPPGEYAFEAWDVYCDGAFQYTEYYISVK